MTTLLHHRSQAILAIALLAGAAVSALAFAPTAVSAQACVNDAGCSVGEVCNYDAGPDYRTCQSLNVTFAQNGLSGTAISGVLSENGIGPFTGYSCLGPLTTCDDQPVTNPLYWVSQGTAPANVSVAITGLRPGRTYFGTFQGAVHGATDLVQTGPFTTFPTGPVAPSATPTDTTASVTWTTGTNASSVVKYGYAAPKWETSPISLTGVDEITGVGSESSGATILVTRAADIWNKTGNTWIKRTNPDVARRRLRAVDINQLSAWAVGSARVILRSSDSGVTWTETPPPATIDSDLLGVFAPTINTAWAVGQNQKILFFDGSSWADVAIPSPQINQPLLGITSLNNKQVWAVGSAGTLYQRADGVTWTKSTLPNASGSTYLYAVSTIDGQNIFVGGSAPAIGGNGRLWRSTNGGSSWTEIVTAHTGTVSGIYQYGPDQFWFIQGSTVGRYVNGTITYADAETASFTGVLAGISGVSATEAYATGESQIFQFGRCFQESTCATPVTTAGNVLNHTVNINGLSGSILHHYTVNSVDVPNRITYSGAGTFTTTSPDLIAPTLTLTRPNPAPGYANFSTRIQRIEGSITDDRRLATMQCANVTDHFGFVDVSAVTPSLPITNPAGVSATFYHQIALGPAEQQVNFDCRVSDGTNSDTQSTSFIYDNTAPTADFIFPHPLDGDPLVGPNFPMQVTGTDANGFGTVEYILNGAAPVSVTPPSGTGGPFTFNLNAAGVISGDNTVDVRFTDKAGNVTLIGGTFFYEAPGFRLALAPSTQTAPAGSSVVYTATVTPLGGFTGNVTLALAGQPAGSTVNFSQNPVTLGATPVDVTVTINTLSTPTGTFTLSLSSPTTPIPTPATATLILTTAPDFSVTTATPSRTVLAGSSIGYTISVNPNATYTGTINSMFIGPVPPTPALPTGVTASFTPGTFSLSPSVNVPVAMNITTTAATPSGTYSIRVSASDATSRTRFVDVTLIVNQPPDVSLTILPATQTITAGAGPAANYNGKAIALNGYNRISNVTASVGSVIPGLTISVTPDTFVPAVGPNGTDFVLSLSADSRVPGATYTVTVTLRADDASLTKTATVTLIVTGDTTPPIISITQPDVTPNFDRATIGWRTNEAADTKIEVFTDPARTVPLGLVFDPAFVMTHSKVYNGGLAPLTTYYLRVSSADQAPTANTASTITYDDGADLTFTTLDTPDFTPPAIHFNTPADGATVNLTVSITGQATDNKRVNTVIITIIPPGCVTTTCQVAQTYHPGTPVYDFAWNWDTLSLRLNGLYTVTADATDGSGNPAPQARITMNVQNDLTKPVILADYPQVININCSTTTNLCDATVLWFTDDASSTQVSYATESEYFATSGYTTTLTYDDADPATRPSARIYTEHRLTITGLLRNELYHYQIMSCNVSGDCSS